MVKTYSLGGRTVAVNRGGAWNYLFQDHLGSPTLEADYDGRAGFRWKYEPYGRMRGNEWTLSIDRGFTGQVIEPGLGLHDYVARHYAQPLGRWIAPDTVVPDLMDPQSLSRYGYVGNRQLQYTDQGNIQVTGVDFEPVTSLSAASDNKTRKQVYILLPCLSLRHQVVKRP
ncbi:MAG: RHS repeat-associated core domain-containing protein [Anaerolineae bacterium]